MSHRGTGSGRWCRPVGLAHQGFVVGILELPVGLVARRHADALLVGFRVAGGVVHHVLVGHCITSGAQTKEPPSCAQEGSAGMASVISSQCTRSGELRALHVSPARSSRRRSRSPAWSTKGSGSRSVAPGSDRWARRERRRARGRRNRGLWRSPAPAVAVAGAAVAAAVVGTTSRRSLGTGVIVGVASLQPARSQTHSRRARIAPGRRAGRPARGAARVVSCLPSAPCSRRFAR